MSDSSATPSITDFKDLYKYCVELFGESYIKRKDFTDPEGIEITVDLSKLEASPIHELSLALYRGNNPQSFMHINDFTFEYDADEKKAFEEMGTYLKAIRSGRVNIKSWKILGLKIHEKLLIRK